MAVKKKRKALGYYVIAVILLLIFLYFSGILRLVSPAVFGKVTNSQAAVYDFFTKLKSSFVNFQEAQNLKKENLNLSHQISQLTYDNTQLQVYKQEYDKLRQMMNFFEKNDYQYAVARVIGRDWTKTNTLIINKGLHDGIKEGFPAIIDNGIIIGKVIESKENIAIVLLLKDNLSKIAVSKVETQKTCGLAQGSFGLNMIVDKIPQNIEVKEDDIFITSGAEKNIPRGLIVGKVNRIISQASDLFKTISLSATMDYEEISIVSIIIPQENLNE